MSSIGMTASALSVLCVVGFGAAASRMPHAQLAAELASGEIDGAPIPITDFVPVPFKAGTAPVRCGEVVLWVPQGTKVEPASLEAMYVRLETDGVRCSLCVPRRRMEGEADLPASTSSWWADGEEALARRVEICASHTDGLSFWTSPAKVDAIRERLALRALLCMGAQHVEIVRNDTLLGLLLIRRFDGRVCMVLDYFSKDNRVQGQVILQADSGAPEAEPLARAIISSLRIDIPPGP